MAIENVLNKYCTEQDPARPALKKLLEDLLDWFMLSEREIYLSKNDDDKGNGFYDRKLATPIGNLEISVPRTREGSFRPHILPKPYKRIDQSYTELLMSLVINGYSETALLNTLKSLNLPYSEDELTKIKNNLKNELDLFKQRELPQQAFALIIDAYHCEIKDSSKVKKAACYIILGIDMDGKKDIFGMYTSFGKENRADWNKVFEDLINRSLKKVLIVVSDDFPGIIETIKAVYPYADHQLCLVHLQRNVRKHMDKTNASNFNKELDKIKLSSSFDEAIEKFEQLCSKFKEKYPRFINSISQKSGHFFAFTKYPDEVRKHIYSTNAVESVNSLIEKIRIKSGGYFNSMDILEINIYLQRENLKQTKWKKPASMIKAHIYDIHQLFQLRYFTQTQNS
ncbi:transposase mutator type [Caldicellulosiruptor owensensis OL]|uniref:Mutator family transposase n=1 Tax=Caldicellulosiruptor owensensis (strain ATCC 700167 / DSM 13100 / OL) TaxID=632518 RepID=E4Q649_CALOW|nr:IS256 family transposase [Caldicellulosiruptor owensensis]ADQ05534.1 transposase mutator type [Caldicellulosiruptor owensensis OL]